MDKYLIFHASSVDSSSVTAHDSGTNIDLGCFKVSDISAIMAEEDYIYIYFKNAGRFEGGPVGSASELLEQSFVRLTVEEGKELNVIKDLTKSFYVTRTMLLFDAVNGEWAIGNITAIQIRRHLTTHTIASD